MLYGTATIKEIAEKGAPLAPHGSDAILIRYQVPTREQATILAAYDL